MRKLLAVVALLAMGVVLAIPAFAQERPTLTELLANDPDGRFTTLVAAIDAAGLTDTLNSEGPFTVLAPTNDAFDAGLALLGMTTDQVLANPDMLRNILLYHVIPGSFFFRNLASGPTETTAYADETVQFHLDGAAFTVNGINIDDVDNLASNGIVHVLEDGILLPPGLFPGAHVRVAHFSPDAPAVDVYVNGAVGDVTNLAFGSVSAWMEVPAGSVSIAVAPAGTSLDDAAIGPLNLSFGPGTWTTIAAIGSLENGTLTAQAITEDMSTVADGQARVTFFHAIEGAPAVDVRANNRSIVTELAYPGTSADGSNDGAFTVTVPAGVINVQVVATGTTTPALIDLPGTEITAGMSYLVAAVGTLDNPSAVIVSTDLAALMTPTEEAMPANGGTTGETEATPEATEIPLPEMTPEATEAA